MNEIPVRHDEYVDEVRRRYQADGYEELDTREIKQALAINYEPDLVVRRGNEVIVIEVKNAESPRQKEQLQQIRQTIESRPDWRFRFMVVPRRPAAPAADDDLDNAHLYVQRSRDWADEQPAISAVVLWIALEIAMRRLLTLRQQRPPFGTTGLALARRLRDLGELDDDDLKLINTGLQTRDLAAHGYKIPPEFAMPPALYDLVDELIRQAGLARDAGPTHG